MTPCRLDPVRWDTDRSTRHVLTASAAACMLSCPMLGACRARVEDLTARSRRQEGVSELAGMMWAGHAYDNRGVRIDLTRTDLRLGERREKDTRHVHADGTVFDGHTGTYVTAPPELAKWAR